MSVPLITVLMTVYNGETYLKTSIKSILNQTFKDFEFLIINDASTDSTLELIKSFNDTRIIVHNNSKNLGQTASLNIGLKLAKGRYIARMDADDVSYSNRLEKQVDFIKRYPGKYAVVGTDMALIDINGNKKGVQRFPKTFTEIFLSIFYTTPVAHISALMDREVIIKVGGYKEDFIVVQDYDLWSRLIRIGYKLMNLSETLVAGRVHESSVLAMETNTRVPIENSRVIRQNVNLLTKINISEDEALNIFYLFHLPHLLSPIAMKDTEALYKSILMNLRSDFPDRRIGQIRNRNLSKVYYRLGIHQIEDGNMRGARRSFIKSAYKNPIQIKPLILFLLSFLRKNYIKKVRQKLSAIYPS